MADAVAPLGDERHHYWLVRRMAKATGVDLAAAHEAGELPQELWSDMVQRCRGCGWEREGGGCARWLSLQVPGEATAPEPCVNRDRLDALSTS